jgi:hypothetical protein
LNVSISCPHLSVASVGVESESLAQIFLDAPWTPIIAPPLRQ